MITTDLFKQIKSSITPEQIYRKYIHNVKFDTRINSPLRDNDGTPSFIIYTNSWAYNDFGLNSGDCFTFVKTLFNLNFHEALIKIKNDFRNDMVLTNNVKPVYTKKKKTVIKPVYRKWMISDKTFWQSFGISKKTLEFFKVNPLLGFYFLKTDEYQFIKAKTLMYAYVIGSRFKIYNPFDKNNKFYGNTSKNSIQGYTQIDFNKNHLIITSSLKDVMLLYEYGIQAIAPSSESTIIDKPIIDYLIKQFKHVYIFYDWDTPGIKLAEQHSKIYNVNYIVPEGFEELVKLKIKDPSDYYKQFKQTKTLNFLKHVITNKIQS